MLSINELKSWATKHGWQELPQGGSIFRYYLTPTGAIVEIGVNKKGHIKRIGMGDHWELEERHD